MPPFVVDFPSLLLISIESTSWLLRSTGKIVPGIGRLQFDSEVCKDILVTCNFYIQQFYIQFHTLHGMISVIFSMFLVAFDGCFSWASDFSKPDRSLIQIPPKQHCCLQRSGVAATAATRSLHGVVRRRWRTQ